MEVQSDPAAALLRSRMLRLTEEELSNTNDENLALRKALLALLFTGSEREAYFGDFRDYLLRDFRPLANAFDESESHPFLAGQDIRLLDKSDGTELLIHETLISTIMKAPINDDELVDAGLRLPWDVTNERLVGCFFLYDFYRTTIKAGNYDNIGNIVEELEQAVSSVESFGPWKDQSDGPQKYSGSWIRMVQQGDLLFLFTRDVSERSQITMFLAAQSLFLRVVGLGYGLRGGVGCGDCTADFGNNIFHGFAMFAARQLAARQAWFGVAFDIKVDELMAVDEGAAPDISDWVPITDTYDVPTRTDSKSEALTVLNWPMMFKDNIHAADAFLDQLKAGDPDFNSCKQHAREFAHEMIRRMAGGGHG